MKFLVTGATGFIGGAVARRLAESGHDVRALVRPGQDSSDLEHIGVHPVNGDLSNEQALIRGLDGVDGLFNVAGHYAFWARDRSIFYKTNFDGVKHRAERGATGRSQKGRAHQHSGHAEMAGAGAGS